MRWPRSSSGAPTTAASSTDGWLSSFDFAGAHLEAPGLDDVERLPADDAVEAVGVDDRCVAGAEPLIVERRRRCLRAAEVAVEEGRTGDMQLADRVAVVRRR